MKQEVGMSEGTGTIRCTDRDGDAHLPSAYPRANGEERDTEKRRRESRCRER